jgi:hypothetical protein
MIYLGEAPAIARAPDDLAIPGIVLARPDRLTASAWLEHIPFAFWLAQALRPNRFVELGTHTGASFCAFLQAFAALGIAPSAAAVDTWRGDAQSGLYDEGVYDDLRAYTDARYGARAELLRMTFDEALPRFPDGSIDLLHIDGFHSFEAVRHDFETWRPKLSPRAVVLFHDTQVRDPGFGVWRFWQDLSATTPHFEFQHGYGLGVACIGAQCPAELRNLAALSDQAEEADRVRQIFAALGERISARVQEELQRAAWAQSHARWDEERERARGELEQAAIAIREAEAAAHRQAQVLAEQAAILAEQGRILDEQGRVLDEQGRILHEQGQLIDAQTAMIGERDRTLAALSATPRT